MAVARLAVVLVFGAVLVATLAAVDRTPPAAHQLVSAVASNSTTTTVAPSTTTTTAPTTTTSTAPTTTTSTTSTTVAVEGSAGVYLIGDSVLLGAKEELPIALPGRDVIVDAEGSRRLPQGIEELRALLPDIVGDVVVVDLGNNYIPGEGVFADQVDETMEVLADAPRVVWVTLAEKWPSRVELNATIRDRASRWPNAVVADWATVAAAHPEFLDDGLHLTPDGQTALAELIATTITGEG